LELSAIRAALSHLDRIPTAAYLAVNASPVTVCAPALGELLTGPAAARVVLELTEHSDVDDHERLIAALDDLRCSGVRLAVDDTGAGFASLQRLIDLRPDVIKLDRVLVTGIDADPARRALAGALLAFAREVGATVVAEGIENAHENTVVRRLGVRYGQGFHLGRPGPLPLVDQEQNETRASGHVTAGRPVI
jgi:EAL domain-containing protein (putative c-di-GMP-specific phosphodiesterase class I)